MIATTLLTLLLAAASTAAFGQPQERTVGDLSLDANESIDIEAGSLQLQDSDRLAVFLDGVEVVQGNLRITAERIEIRLAENGDEGLDGTIETMEAMGSVVVVGDEGTLRGNKATYDLVEETLVVVGDVILEREGSRLKGAHLEVNLVTGKLSLTGGERRVRATFTSDPTDN